MLRVIINIFVFHTTYKKHKRKILHKNFTYAYLFLILYVEFHVARRKIKVFRT